MWGIGPRGAEALHRKGIRTFSDLAARDVRPEFGADAIRLRALAVGDDDRVVVTSRAPKSIGHETTFRENVSDRQVLHNTLVALTDMVAARVRKHGLRARVVAIKVRYEPFRTITRRVTLDNPASATRPILKEVLRLFSEKTPAGAGPVRLLGVSTSGFTAQASLFTEKRHEDVDRAVDLARKRFGTAAIKRGSVLETGDG
jgi:DNA polymerase-4